MSIAVGQLLLDTANPRHEPVESQRDAIHALIQTERQKLVVLSNDIGERGFSPMDRLLAIKDGRRYVVVEGNRRLAAVRLLANPDLAEGTVIETAIRRVAKGATVIPDEADCAVLDSRDEAGHWMRLRHDGEAGGAGVVRWNSFATNRFSHKPGTQAARAIKFLESVTEGYPENDVIQDLAQNVADKRLTTLGRLVQDPNFRDRVGFVEDGASLRFHFPAGELQDFFEHVLGDLAADVGVSQLKSKEQRTEYLANTPEPKATERMDDAKPLGETPSSKAPKSQTSTQRRKSSKPAKPFKDLDLQRLGPKTQALLREFRRLNADKSPNASAVLTRAILELAVDEFMTMQNLLKDQKFRKRVQACLAKVDASGKAPEYQALRAGLADGTSLYSVNTLHGFVHNPYYHADGTTVRNIAANLEPFLQQLNDLA